MSHHKRPSSGSAPATLPIGASVAMAKWMGDKFRLIGKVSSARRRKVFRGQVYWVEFGQNIGSEQCKRRPAVILQNDPANKTSPNTIVAPITNTADTNPSVYALNRPAGSPVSGNVLLANVVTISKARLDTYICDLDLKTEMPGIEASLRNALGTDEDYKKLQRALADKTSYSDRVKKQRNEAQDDLKAVRDSLGLSDDADAATILKEIEKLKKED